MIYGAGPAGVGWKGEDAAKKDRQRGSTLELPLATRRGLDAQLPFLRQKPWSIWFLGFQSRVIWESLLGVGVFFVCF